MLTSVNETIFYMSELEKSKRVSECGLTSSSTQVFSRPRTTFRSYITQPTVYIVVKVPHSIMKYARNFHRSEISGDSTISNSAAAADVPTT